MTVISRISDEIKKIGYTAILSDYVYSDIFVASSPDRIAPLAVFTNTPTSYRNAAIAVVEADGRTITQLTREFRALGAPLLFVVTGDSIGVWQVTANGIQNEVASAKLEHLQELFSKHAEMWGPESIHRAKAIGQFQAPAQLDFVDLGLLPAIEGELHAKLDTLLNETLAEAVRVKQGSARYQIDQRMLFRTIFRLLAAKVLQDRNHALSLSWDSSDISSVLKVISKYYTLVAIPGEQNPLHSAIFASSWDRLRKGINFRNISADDLAFVYENTLITTETRQDFGTHGTPRAIAEYVVNRLKLAEYDPHNLRVYEPFAGAGVFMVAALRNLRENLPLEWSDEKRHHLLVNRITGDEIDPFAKEVATLSLILADYPSANGWKVTEIDLFKNDNLRERVRQANIILCNPPFQDFTPNERKNYPEITLRSVSKPIAALDAVIDSVPDAFGFVLPEPFIKGARYQSQREKIEKKYRDIEIVELPDRMFKHATIRTSLLIARERRDLSKSSVTCLTSSVVNVRDREHFLRTGNVSVTRTATHASPPNLGNLWIAELAELWEWFRTHPTLSAIASVHRGIEWPSGQQSLAISATPKKGFVAGISAANAVHTFFIHETGYLDVRPDHLRGGAINFPWSDNKVLANAARLSRGPWCLAAAVDREKLIASQQLYGIWPKANESVEVIAAILNGPLANAYVDIHSPPDRIRLSTLLSIPIPNKLPELLNDLTKRYVRIVSQGADLFSEKRTEHADMLLNQIDALVLKAYDMPPRLEKKLLEHFREASRPTIHEWEHWLPVGFLPSIPLHELLSDQYKVATGPWIQELLKPLPDNEASALREFMD